MSQSNKYPDNEQNSNRGHKKDQDYLDDNDSDNDNDNDDDDDDDEES